MSRGTQVGQAQMWSQAFEVLTTKLILGNFFHFDRNFESLVARAIACVEKT